MMFADIWSNDIQRKVGVLLPSRNWFRFQKYTQNLIFTESDVGTMLQKSLYISLYYKHSLMMFNVYMYN